MVSPDTQHLIARAIRHAANNMLMAAQGNVELMQRAAMADEKQQQRAERALRSLAALRGLIDAQVALSRPDAQDIVEPVAVLNALQPVLDAVLKGRATFTIEQPAAAPAIGMQRPAFDLALLAAVQDAVESGAVVCAIQPAGVVINGRVVPFNPSF